jgi:hypothetical protein
VLEWRGLRPCRWQPLLTYLAAGSAATSASERYCLETAADLVSHARRQAALASIDLCPTVEKVATEAVYEYPKLITKHALSIAWKVRQAQATGAGWHSIAAGSDIIGHEA